MLWGKGGFQGSRIQVILKKKDLKNENIFGPALDNILSFDQGLLFLPLPRLVRASIYWRNFWSSGRICQNQGKFYNLF